MNNNLNTPITFACGKTMKNRFMLSPLTNKQSHEDGSLSDIEFNWLTKRAEGQFGLVMTCATSVQANGKCWSGQLGIYDDKHLPGHQRLVQKIQAYGSLAVTQLHHGGMRSDEALTGEKPVGPSDNEAKNMRGLSLAEVEKLRDDFIAAAVRAQKAGYDGVEVHGAHGYMLTQFISKKINQRTDQYGGSLENRSRLLFEIVQGIREACGKAFLLGVRLSPERFGMELQEIKTISQQLIDSELVDFLDLSLWDVFKPSEVNDQSLMTYLVEALDRKAVKLTVAGKVRNGKAVQSVMDAGIDFVTIGTAAILHHDFPVKVINDPDFQTIQTPVTVEYLQNEGLGQPLIEYLQDRWTDFVAS
ncbi:NADH:flavin oxidoreductase [marine bacterium AO1-C]|nr:NADH:flavin oxidoreductase [marine bacterium AO1-C]